MVTIGTGIRLIAKSRSAPLVAALTAAATFVVAAWPTATFTVDLDFAAQPRGVGLYEPAGVVLALVLPELSRSALAIDEFRATRRRGLLLSAHSLLLLLLPILPFAAWYARVVKSEDLPSPLPVVGGLLIYACVGTLLGLLLPRLVGILVGIACFAGLLVAQNLLGTGVLASTFFTGEDWQTRWPVVTCVVAVTAAATFATHGVGTRRRVLAHN